MEFDIPKIDLDNSLEAWRVFFSSYRTATNRIQQEFQKSAISNMLGPIRNVVADYTGQYDDQYEMIPVFLERNYNPTVLMVRLMRGVKPIAWSAAEGLWTNDQVAIQKCTFVTLEGIKERVINQILYDGAAILEHPQEYPSDNHLFRYI